MRTVSTVRYAPCAATVKAVPAHIVTAQVGNFLAFWE